MDLYVEILARVLRNQEISVTISNLHLNANEIVELTSYQLLNKIKTIIANGRLDDECFMKIEKIICLFESMDVTGLMHHDL